MAIVPGAVLGSYEIVGLLGAGGMGEVFRARDTRLNRDVALKVLPALFESDPDRLARFRREAQMLAALNHPQIAAIYGLEEVDGRLALVLELVEGATLAERLARGPLPLRDALTVAQQIALALEAAHAKGIVHRDLKPANIKTTELNVIKVLDFGLAKHTDQDLVLSAHSADAPTLPADVTLAGAIVGTASYMSPEQARGLPVDKRTDLWAFGCVLFEMLTGRKAFGAVDTVHATIGTILEREPDWRALPAATPPRVCTALRRCLQKDRTHRPPDIGDVRRELEAAIAATHGLSSWRLTSSALAAAAIVAASIAAYLVLGRNGNATQRSLVDLKAVALTTYPGQELYPSFSSDGKQVAFSWNGSRQDNFDIYVQLIGVGEPLRITDDPGRDYNPVWSPDGRSIAFLRAGPQARFSELRLISPLGGAERKVGTLAVTEVITSPLLLAWCPDSSCLVVSDSQGEGKPDALFLLSLDTGEKRALTHPVAPAAGDSQPSISPDGQLLVFRRNISGGLTGALHLLALDRDRRAAGEPSVLIPATLDGNHPAWTSDSKEVVFSARERLWRIARSGDTTPTRLPFVGEDGVMPAISRATSGLAYVRSAVDTNIWRIDTARVGEPSASPPRVAISSTRQDGNPQLSPDGRRVAFASNRSGEVEVWLTDPDGANALQLTAMSAAATGSPRWSPDGESIAFNSNLEGHWDVYVVASSGGRPRRLTDTPSNDSAPSFSRDGRWIYFNSNRTGEFQIWKMPAAGGQAAQVTHNGGYIGFESPDGAFLYYTQTLSAASPLWRVPTSGGRPERIVDGVIWRNFVVLERGVYFIAQDAGTTQLQFIDTVTHRIATIARGLGDVRYGLTATADGRAVLYTRVDSVTDDIMLVENYR